MKITIQSAQGRGTFAFDNEVKVGEAVAQAVQAFKFPAACRYGLLLSGNAIMPLDADRTLASYSIHDSGDLYLAMTGC